MLFSKTWTCYAWFWILPSSNFFVTVTRTSSPAQAETRDRCLVASLLFSLHPPIPGALTVQSYCIIFSATATPTTFAVRARSFSGYVGPSPNREYGCLTLGPEGLPSPNDVKQLRAHASVVHSLKPAVAHPFPSASLIVSLTRYKDIRLASRIYNPVISSHLSTFTFALGAVSSNGIRPTSSSWQTGEVLWHGRGLNDSET